MNGRRPSLRLAVLLAYALVVHALVWATAAGAGRLDSAFCRGASTDATAPHQPVGAAADCELACAAATILDAPPPAVFLPPPSARPDARLPVATNLSRRHWGDAYPRGPPAV